MVDIEINAQRVSPLETPGAYSAEGIDIEELRNRSMVQVFARKGSEQALCQALGITATPSRSTILDDFTALPLSPGQWMLTGKSGDDGGFCRTMLERVAELGYVSEQSQGRVVIRISGKYARDLLQKGCRLDLHERVTGIGFCAQTPIAQMGVLLHQINDEPAYDLHIYSGFARSFWQWLTHSAAQYGVVAS